MSKQIGSQRLRNLTTHRKHTEMENIYEDLEWLCGESGLMTHMLPNMLEAVTPWLRQYVTDEKYWDGKYDTSHVEVLTLPTPTTLEREEMWNRYRALPSPFARLSEE
jgi:hypothetical protein